MFKRWPRPFDRFYSPTTPAGDVENPHGEASLQIELHGSEYFDLLSRVSASATRLAQDLPSSAERQVVFPGRRAFTRLPRRSRASLAVRCPRAGAQWRQHHGVAHVSFASPASSFAALGTWQRWLRTRLACWRKGDTPRGAPAGHLEP